MANQIIPWDEIRTEYITTNTSYRRLAEKYGVHRAVIGGRGKAEKWPDQRAQYKDKLQTAAEAAAIDEAVDKGLTAIREIGDVACESIRKMQKLIDDAPNGTQAEASVSALKALLLIIRDCYGILTAQEQEKNKLDREKLDLEKEKAQRGVPDENTDKIIIGSEVYGV